MGAAGNHDDNTAFATLHRHHVHNDIGGAMIEVRGESRRQGASRGSFGGGQRPTRNQGAYGTPPLESAEAQNHSQYE